MKSACSATVMPALVAPLIYNLFPRLVGPMDEWVPHFKHAADLLFDWVYVNPFHYPGFSGSLYAVKDHYALNPLFLPTDAWPKEKNELSYLERLVKEAEACGINLMMDLVINHTSKDSILAEPHPDWYLREKDGSIKSPSAIDPADSRKVTVWGDLGDIDNHKSKDRENLWRYWEKLVETYVELGFTGFRCDAAYHVPADLWRRLIEKAKRKNSECLFFAETLGCRLEEVADLEEAGFDLIASSSKWWNLSEPWCLKQHEEFRDLAPSVSFPETHDTERLAKETGGLQSVQEQRYLFAATFSAGLLMPIGYEYGFQKRLNVVDTTPEEMEEPSFDICDFVRQTNRLQRSLPIMQTDGTIEVAFGLDGPVLCLKKTQDKDTLLVVINKDWQNPQSIKFDLAPLTNASRHTMVWPTEERLNGTFERELPPCSVWLISA